MKTAEVLILEPTKSATNGVCKALQELDLEPFVSTSFSDAIEHAKHRSLAVIIADMAALSASKQDLETAIRSLRATQGWAKGHRMAVILTTLEDDVEAHEEAIRAGADGYLSSSAAASSVIVQRMLSVIEQLFAQVANSMETRKASAPLAAVSSDASSGDSRQHVTEVFQLRDAHLRSDSGRWDARKIADAMGVALTELAAAIDVGYKTVFRTPDSESLQLKLAPFANVLAMAYQTYQGDEERVRMWLRSQQAQLGGKSALQGLLMPGKAAAVESFVTNAWVGIPA